jgi:hypothetical protein
MTAMYNETKRKSDPQVVFNEVRWSQMIGEDVLEECANGPN